MWGMAQVVAVDTFSTLEKLKSHDLRQLARSLDPEHRSLVAQQMDTPDDVLRDLSVDGSSEKVRMAAKSTLQKKYPHG